MLEDGTAPREEVAVTICDGPAEQAARTDPKGSFSMRFRAGEYALQDCVVRAHLKGYTGEPISLRGRRWTDTAPIGAILLHRTGSVEGRTVSAKALAVPKKARTAYDKGQKAADKGKVDQARSQFEDAVRLYPEFAPAWARLGEIQANTGQPERAAQSFENAIRADPKYMDPYLGLAAVLMSVKQWDKLTAIAEKALKLNPTDYPQAYYASAVGNYYLRNLEAAEGRAREGVGCDSLSRWPQMRRILAEITAARRNYAEASSQFSEYLRLAPNAPDAEDIRKRLAQVEELAAAALRP
jgi:tetratricopeptide (TPR) repeat protein